MRNVLYRPLAGGSLCRAQILSTRPDGTVDIDVDAGCKDRVHLSRIKLCAAATEPGTCALEGKPDGEEAADRNNRVRARRKPDALRAKRPHS